MRRRIEPQVPRARRPRRERVRFSLDPLMVGDARSAYRAWLDELEEQVLDDEAQRPWRAIEPADAEADAAVLPEEVHEELLALLEGEAWPGSGRGRSDH